MPAGVSSASSEVPGPTAHPVLTCGELPDHALEALFATWRVEVVLVADGETIPGSYWGEPEAGIVGARLYVRRDTPVHSALHEGCHLLCMDAERRRRVERDAGGDELEESAVCYLQVLLAARLPGASAERVCADMDVWGYSFRVGSTRRWFEEDAEDAREWLRARGLLDSGGPTALRLPASSAAATIPVSCASS